MRRELERLLASHLTPINRDIHRIWGEILRPKFNRFFLFLHCKREDIRLECASFLFSE